MPTDNKIDGEYRSDYPHHQITREPNNKGPRPHLNPERPSDVKPEPNKSQNSK